MKGPFVPRWIYIFLLSVAAVCAPAAADEARDAATDKALAAWDRPDTPGLAIVVLRDGKVVHSRGYGMANLEYGIANTPTTVFHVASLSKQFTAFAIHLLAREGRLSLDDEVRKYVPELQVQGPPITLRHLLHHTSGLRDQWNLALLSGLRLDDTISEADLLGLLRQQKQLNFNPGDEELYSNSGYMLLGLVVQRASGQPLAAFAKERIFDPLGMRNTHFQEHYGTLVKNRAYSYYRTPQGYRYTALSYSNVGATSLFTTIEDMVRWERNVEDKRVGGEEVAAAMLRTTRLNNGREIDYASGLVKGRYRGLPIVAHSGSDAGYRSQVLRFPEQRLSIVLLGNASEVNAGALARAVADVHLEGTSGLAPRPTRPKEIEIDAQALTDYLGDYEMRPGFILKFTAERSQLMVQATGQQRYPLFASAPDEFFTKAFESSVHFLKRSSDGVGAVWRQGGQEFPLRRIVRETPDAQALQACAGDYYSDELRTVYTVSLREGKLMLRYPRGELELTPLTRDMFAAAFPVHSVTFRRGASGACEGFGVTTGRVRNLSFSRVSLASGG